MKLNLLTSIFCCITLLPTACTSNKEIYKEPDFPIEKQLVSKTITPADSLLIQYAYGLYADEEDLYVLTLKDKQWLHVYDKQSGKQVASGIPYGQGPGEITSGVTLSFNSQEQTFDIYDERLRKLFTYRYDKQTHDFSFIDSRSFTSQQGIVRRAWTLDEHLVLTDAQQGHADTRKTRFQLYRNDSLVSHYDIFPTTDEQVYPAFVLNSVTSLSPDRKKLATATLFGGILETFNLDHANITPLSTRYFYPPHIQFEGGSIHPTPETIYGFSTICASNERVYAVLIGEKDPNRFNKICVFDWKGQEIAQYHTDCLVFSLSICPSEKNKLYAIAFSREEGFYLVSFDLGNTY